MIHSKVDDIILSHIVAIAANHVIGKNNELPWHIPADLKFFREKTKGHLLIMGRKTFESLKKPLPHRFHFVITRNHSSAQQNPFDNVVYVSSFEEAVAQAKTMTSQWGNEIFVLGGGEIFKQTIHHMNRLYITLIHQNFQGDVFYPPIPTELFTLTESKEVTEAEAIPFCFQTWDRIKNT